VLGNPFSGPDTGSNTGSCVSLFAPARDITSARHTALGTASGTSFSSPLAAAIAARFIEKQIAVTGNRPSYSGVYSWLTWNAVWNISDRGLEPYDICVRADPGGYSVRWQQPCPDGFLLVPMRPTATNGKMLHYHE
jgi:subtilisin family serine protease